MYDKEREGEEVREGRVSEGISGDNILAFSCLVGLLLWVWRVKGGLSGRGVSGSSRDDAIWSRRSVGEQVVIRSPDRRGVIKCPAEKRCSSWTST